MRTLRRGDRGEDVERLQNALNRAGCTLTVDGIFGTDTYTAVICFQEVRGLVVDGVVGPATWTKLLEVKPTNTQLYNAFITCLDAVQALPEFKQLEDLLNG